MEGETQVPTQPQPQQPAPSQQPAPRQPQQPQPQQPQQPAPQQPPAAPPTPTVDPEIAHIREELSKYKAAEAADNAAKAQAEAKRLVDAGRAEEVAKHYQAQLDAERREKASFLDRYRNAEKSRTITAALSGHQLAHAEAATDLLNLWANDFEVIDTPDGGLSVREKTSLRPAVEVIKERLASPRWSPYVAATSRGGGGPLAPGALPTGQTETPAANLGEHLLSQWNGRAQTRGMAGLHAKTTHN